MRVERIRESLPHVLKLTDTQAALLRKTGNRLASEKAWWGESDVPLAERSVISCVPIGGGEWSIRVHDAVGMLSIGDLQIVVEPKIPTLHLLYLFAKSKHVPRLDEQRGSVASDADLWELIARWFVRAAGQLLRRDLAKDYCPIEASLKVVRGQINALPTARSFYLGRFDIDCHFDEFQVDTPLNRTLKAATRVIQGNPLLSLEVRRDAARLLSRLDDIGDLRDSDFSALTDRRTAYYADATTLARHILKAVGRTLDAGGETAWTFLIRTPELVETGVREVLRDSLGPTAVMKKGRQLGGTTMTVNPDLLFDGALADVKYKRRDNQWNRADLYQVVTFATAFRTPVAGLMDFSDDPFDKIVDEVLQVGDVEVHRLSWPCSIPDPRVAASRFGRRVSNWLKNSVRSIPRGVPAE